ncbi:MAG TPA: cytochrome c peroxidase [Kofleriaceae bacterium]|jgi:cytochrome c peroxidase
MYKLALLTIALAGCSSTPAPDAHPVADARAEPAAVAEASAPQVDKINPRLLRRFKPVRADLAGGVPSTPAMVTLGRQLFFDKRLSKNHNQSCNTCHQLDRYGVDGQVTSVGSSGERGRRNSPSVYHAAGQFSNFWDGRADNVEDQAGKPIMNPVEMGMGPPADVMAVVGSVPGYVEEFHAAFPGDAQPVTFENLDRAIGAFERKLVTPSRWDRYLTGDHAALTADEVAGLKLFTDIGCVTCHTGELVGGSMFQKVGVMQPWPNQSDRGRAEVTHQAADEMQFKVPSLRNVAKTAPYFHDGSIATLPEAVRMMARYQLGEELGDDDIRLIVAWLGSLTGELPAEYIKAPALPPDGPAR